MRQPSFLPSEFLRCSCDALNQTSWRPDAVENEREVNKTCWLAVYA